MIERLKFPGVVRRMYGTDPRAACFSLLVRREDVNLEVSVNVNSLWWLGFFPGGVGTADINQAYLIESRRGGGRV